jgi:hypothetical protein
MYSTCRGTPFPLKRELKQKGNVKVVVWDVSFSFLARKKIYLARLFVLGIKGGKRENTCHYIIA